MGHTYITGLSEEEAFRRLEPHLGDWYARNCLLKARTYGRHPMCDFVVEFWPDGNYGGHFCIEEPQPANAGEPHRKGPRVIVAGAAAELDGENAGS